MTTKTEKTEENPNTAGQGNAAAVHNEVVLRLSKDAYWGMQEALSEHDRLCEMLSESRKSIGNMAAMRKALCDIVILTMKVGHSIRGDVACGIIASKAKHALFAPPRRGGVRKLDNSPPFSIIGGANNPKGRKTMSDRQEKMADIVAELRNKTGDMYDSTITMYEDEFHSYADRIEEACEKERELLRSCARWILTHDIYGNMAKELLVECKEVLHDDGRFLLSEEGAENDKV